MGWANKMGLKREEGIPFRLTAPEKKRLKKLADAAGLSMAEYVRCKTFDIPVEVLSGKASKPPTQS